MDIALFISTSIKLLSAIFIFVVGLLILIAIILYVKDRTQKESTILRNYPLIGRIRSVTGKPLGFKSAISSYQCLEELCALINARGEESAPDFITGDGGSGAGPRRLKRQHARIVMENGLSIPMDQLHPYPEPMVAK